MVEDEILRSRSTHFLLAYPHLPIYLNQLNSITSDDLSSRSYRPEVPGNGINLPQDDASGEDSGSSGQTPRTPSKLGVSNLRPSREASFYITLYRNPRFCDHLLLKWLSLGGMLGQARKFLPPFVKQLLMHYPVMKRTGVVKVDECTTRSSRVDRPSSAQPTRIASSRSVTTRSARTRPTAQAVPSMPRGNIVYDEYATSYVLKDLFYLEQQRQQQQQLHRQAEKEKSPPRPTLALSQPQTTAASLVSPRSPSTTHSSRFQVSAGSGVAYAKNTAMQLLFSPNKTSSPLLAGQTAVSPTRDANVTHIPIDLIDVGATPLAVMSGGSGDGDNSSGSGAHVITNRVRFLQYLQQQRKDFALNQALTASSVNKKK